MKRVLSIAVFSLLFVLISTSAFGAKRYWIKATAGKWNNTANWSSTSGGAGGSSVPGASDTAYFDGNGTGNDTLDMNVSVKYLSVAGGYTGKIVQGTYTVTIGTTGAALAGGTFEGGSANITLTGALTISGCAFTSTSGTLTTSSNFTVNGTGSFTHNSGVMKFTATNTITGSVTMYKVEFAPTATATYTIASGTTLTITNTLTISGTVTATLNTGNINVSGDVVITNSGTGSGGSATLTFTGSSNQLLDGSPNFAEGRLPNVVINKTGGTLTLQDYINVSGNWTRTAGDVDPGTSTVGMIATKTISGTDTLYNAIFAGGGTFTISGGGSTLNVTNTFTNQGLYDQVFNTGTIKLYGDIVVTNTGTSANGTATFNICGSGNQTLDGASASTEGRFPNVVINKTGGTLYLQDYITVNGNWTRTAGDVDPGTSSVIFSSTKTIAGTDTLYDVRFGGSASTFTISNTLNVLNSFFIAGGTFAQTFNTGTINVYGDVTSTNTATTGGGSATIKLVGSSTQTFTGSGTAGQGRFCNITIDKASGTLNLVSVISVNGNWNYIKGDVDPGTSSVALYGTFNLDGQQEGSSTMMRFYSLAVGSGTRTLTGNADINNNFTISSGATCNANGNNMNVAGNWNAQGTFTYSTGTVTFDGSSYNTIKAATGTTAGFGNVAFNRGTGSVTLMNPVRVNTSMTITKGRIKTTSTNYLEFVDNATCTTATHSAYVHGPVRKTGNDAFTFPLGDTTLNDTAAFHPLAITAPGATGDQFEAVYYASGQTLGTTLVDSLMNLSTCERWSLERRSGTSNPTVTVSWNANSCNTSSYANLRMAGWNGTQWEDLGATSITVSGNRGSITSTYNLSYVSNVANIAIATKKYTPPYAVLRKKLDGGYYQVNNGRLLFRYEEEYEDNSNLTFFIYNEQNQVVSSSQIVPANMQLQVNYGDNRYELNTANCNISADGALDNGFYILEVINDKNEKWYLRFKQDISTLIINCNPTPEEQ
jgi:hypothetical protein